MYRIYRYEKTDTEGLEVPRYFTFQTRRQLIKYFKLVVRAMRAHCNRFNLIPRNYLKQYYKVVFKDTSFVRIETKCIIYSIGVDCEPLEVQYIQPRAHKFRYNPFEKLEPDISAADLEEIFQEAWKEL